MAYIPNPRNARRPKSPERLYKIELDAYTDKLRLTVITRSKCYPVGYHYILEAKNYPYATLQAFQRFQLAVINRLNSTLVCVIAYPDHLELHFKDHTYLKLTRHDLPTLEGTTIKQD